ncbi:unnamed protein product [Camellia sinensis]
MATPCEKTVLPPALDSTSEPPPVFDGTIRLYISYTCPFAQRAWIARNHKGLQDKIKLVAIKLQNRPAWYKEKVYPENKEIKPTAVGRIQIPMQQSQHYANSAQDGEPKAPPIKHPSLLVPSLEHNNKVIGESLDLLKYIDSNFEGPSLLPNDPAKRQFAEEMLSYSDTVNKTVFTSFKGDPAKETGGVFDYLETALHKFDDGPFFLGQFSMVDMAYVPFIERFQLFIQDVWKYDIMAGRPKLEAWFEGDEQGRCLQAIKIRPQRKYEIMEEILSGSGVKYGSRDFEL